MTKPDVKSARRKAPKDVRHRQLIDATIDVLATKGFSALTIADVARAAQLSVGMVIFHFGSKERLLAATLEALAAEYLDSWQRALAAAKPTPAARLEAMLLSGFMDENFSLRLLQAWIAFWGETQGRPLYDEICAASDEQQYQRLEDLCAELITAGNYPLNPTLCAQALDAISDGLWLKAVNSASRVPILVSAASARAVIMANLAAFFPKHFRVASVS